MVRADANSGWPGEEIGIQSGLFAQLTTRCSTGRLPRSTRPPGEPNPATDAAQQRAEPGGLFCLRVNATGTDGWPAHAVTERPPRWRSHALSAGRWPTARPLHQATPAGRNGVISELLPIGVLLFIRYQKRQGRRPGALAWTALVGAHAYSLTVPTRPGGTDRRRLDRGGCAVSRVHDPKQDGRIDAADSAAERVARFG